ncbi:MAG: hypothetical protein WDZ93_04080 [Candidatus Paceibacterota bacterium]
MNILLKILACHGIDDIDAFSVSPEGKWMRSSRHGIFRSCEEVEAGFRRLRWL